MVTIVMHQYNLDPVGAMAWIGEYNDRIVKSFISQKDQLPSWGEEMDSQVAKYVHGLGMYVVGCDRWHSESPKYFGTKGMAKNRVVNVLPRVDPNLGTVINIPTDD